MMRIEAAIRERVEQLEPREQKLLAILVGVFAVMVVLLIPVLVTALVASREEENEQLRAAIDGIVAAREEIQAQEVERKQVIERYSRQAPPLAGYLAQLAQALSIEIPESQDRAPVPHGKRYEERSTKIVLRKVGMKNLATFLEKIETSGYPVRVSAFNLRKRATEPDSWDVTMNVSAFDRKEAPKKAAEEGSEGESSSDEKPASEEKGEEESE